MKYPAHCLSAAILAAFSTSTASAQRIFNVAESTTGQYLTASNWTASGVPGAAGIIAAPLNNNTIAGISTSGTKSVGSINYISHLGSSDANNWTIAANNTTAASVYQVVNNITKGGTGNFTLAKGTSTDFTVNVGGEITTSGGSLVLGASGNNLNAVSVTSAVSVGTGSTLSIYSDSTTLSGNVEVNGTLNGSSAISIASGMTLSGSGTISSGAVTLASGATLAPGNSPGTLTVGAMTLSGDATYAWEINDATGTTGSDPGWDLLNATGVVDIAANSSSPFTIDVASLTALNAGGEAVNFVDSNNYSWTIISAAGGLTFSGGNTVTDSFLIDLTGFTNAYTGTFSVTDVGNDIILSYTAAVIPEPSTYAALAGVLMLKVAIYRRRRNQA